VTDSCEHDNEPSGSIKVGNLTVCTISFSRTTQLHLVGECTFCHLRDTQQYTLTPTVTVSSPTVK
jgi:hypothetical protein